MYRTANPEAIFGVGRRVVRNIEVLGRDFASGEVTLQGKSIEVMTLGWPKGVNRIWAIIDDMGQPTPEDEVIEGEEVEVSNGAYKTRRARKEAVTELS